MLTYTIFLYYIETFIFMFCAPVILECHWRLPFGAKIVHTKTWRMAILIWIKPRDIYETRARCA